MKPVAARLRGLEVILLAFLGAFAAIFLYLTREMGETAAWFPQVVAQATLVLLGLAVAVQVGARKRPPAEARAPLPADALPWPAALAAQVAYIVLIFLLGFPLATLVYLVGAPLQMRYRRWGVISVCAVVLTAAVVGAFVFLFNVRLPAGLVWGTTWQDR